MIWLPDDGPRTITCWSVFNVLMCKFYKFCICAVVGIIIEKENIHQYYQIAKVTVAVTAHFVKLIISIPLETASHHFILYKISTLPERITYDRFVKYSVKHKLGYLSTILS